VRITTFAIALCLTASVISLIAAERPKPSTHTVSLEAMRFQPDDLTVAPGDTIIWVNKDLVPHTATSEAGESSTATTTGRTLGATIGGVDGSTSDAAPSTGGPAGGLISLAVVMSSPGLASAAGGHVCGLRFPLA